LWGRGGCYGGDVCLCHAVCFGARERENIKRICELFASRKFHIPAGEVGMVGGGGGGEERGESGACVFGREGPRGDGRGLASNGAVLFHHCQAQHKCVLAERHVVTAA
jgi:hypothetical protein